MKTEIKGGKLVVTTEMDPKVFKSGKNGWYKQAVVTIGKRKIRMNLIALEDKG